MGGYVRIKTRRRLGDDGSGLDIPYPVGSTNPNTIPAGSVATGPPDFAGNATGIVPISSLPQVSSPGTGFTVNLNLGPRQPSAASGGQVKPRPIAAGAGGSSIETWLQQESLAPGIKNWYLVTGTGLLFVLAMAGKRRR
jgi:hypothetical protein